MQVYDVSMIDNALDAARALLWAKDYDHKVSWYYHWQYKKWLPYLRVSKLSLRQAVSNVSDADVAYWQEFAVLQRSLEELGFRQYRGHNDDEDGYLTFMYKGVVAETTTVPLQQQQVNDKIIDIENDRLIELTRVSPFEMFICFVLLFILLSPIVAAVCVLLIALWASLFN